MFTKYTLDMLTEDSVSVKAQKYIIDGGVTYEVGSPSRKAYVNSVQDRELILTELPVDQQNAILSVWGDQPTVIVE